MTSSFTADLITNKNKCYEFYQSLNSFFRDQYSDNSKEIRDIQFMKALIDLDPLSEKSNTKTKLLLPFSGTSLISLVDPYGPRFYRGRWEWNNGINLRMAGANIPVRSIVNAEGVVGGVGKDDSGISYVRIFYPNIPCLGGPGHVIYAHMKDIEGLKKGEKIKPGQKLGIQGNLGLDKIESPVLHIEIRKGDKESEVLMPVDPSLYLPLSYFNLQLDKDLKEKYRKALRSLGGLKKAQEKFGEILMPKSGKYV